MRSNTPLKQPSTHHTPAALDGNAFLLLTFADTPSSTTDILPALHRSFVHRPLPTWFRSPARYVYMSPTGCAPQLARPPWPLCRCDCPYTVLFVEAEAYVVNCRSRTAGMSSLRRSSMATATSAMAPPIPAWTAWSTSRAMPTNPILYELPLPASLACCNRWVCVRALNAKAVPAKCCCPMLG